MGKPWLAVVLANNLPRAGKAGAPPLKVPDFVGSIEMLFWAKRNFSPWYVTDMCAAIAGGGHLDVLQWAWEAGAYTRSLSGSTSALFMG